MKLSLENVEPKPAGLSLAPDLVLPHPEVRVAPFVGEIVESFPLFVECATCWPCVRCCNLARQSASAARAQKPRNLLSLLPQRRLRDSRRVPERLSKNHFVVSHRHA